jgi:hypothetical protein
MSGKLKIIGGMVLGVWLFGAVVSVLVAEVGRRHDCVREEGLIKGLLWCKTDSFNRDGGYAKLVIDGLRWPFLLLKKNDISSSVEQIQITAEQINEAECKNWVSMTRSDLGLNDHDHRFLSAQESIDGCIKTMNENHKKGLPNFATYSTKEVSEYFAEEESKQRQKYLSTAQKAMIEEIKEKCRKISVIQIGFYEDKRNGIKKEEQIFKLRSTAYGREKLSIDDNLFMGLTYQFLDHLYSKSDPINDANLAASLVSHNEKCEELYESTFMLR